MVARLDCGEVIGCVGSLARAVIAVAHARLAERGEWALNDKRMVERAGLTEAAAIVAAACQNPGALGNAVSRMRDCVGLQRPRGPKFDEVLRG